MTMQIIIAHNKRVQGFSSSTRVSNNWQNDSLRLQIFMPCQYLCLYIINMAHCCEWTCQLELIKLHEIEYVTKPEDA